MEYYTIERNYNRMENLHKLDVTSCGYLRLAGLYVHYSDGGTEIPYLSLEEIVFRSSEGTPPRILCRNLCSMLSKRSESARAAPLQRLIVPSYGWQDHVILSLLEMEQPSIVITCIQVSLVGRAELVM